MLLVFYSVCFFIMYGLKKEQFIKRNGKFIFKITSVYNSVENRLCYKEKYSFYCCCKAYIHSNLTLMPYVSPASSFRLPLNDQIYQSVGTDTQADLGCIHNPQGI